MIAAENFQQIKTIRTKHVVAMNDGIRLGKRNENAEIVERC